MNVDNEDGRFYYDHKLNMQPDKDGNINIDRIYRLDWQNFTQEDWDKLGEIYRLLPQYIDKENCCPMWYGDSELPDDELEDVEYFYQLRLNHLEYKFLDI